MTRCIFRIDDDLYQGFQEYCQSQNKSVSEVLREFVHTLVHTLPSNEGLIYQNQALNADVHTLVHTNEVVHTNSVHTPVCTENVVHTPVHTNQSVHTNRQKAVADILRRYNMDKIPEFDENGELVSN